MITPKRVVSDSQTKINSQVSNATQSNYFIHTLLRARDWQHRPEFDQVCDWWRGGGGKTAIAERFLNVLPEVTPEATSRDEAIETASAETKDKQENAVSSPTVFISYSHKDEEWKDRVCSQLGVLVH